MADRFRAYDASGNPAFEGDLVDNATAFDAGDVVIANVVFYDGPVESEAVAGSVIINHSGPVSATMVPIEPDPVENTTVIATGAADGNGAA